MAMASPDEHYSPAVRLCEIVRPASGNCGFHLSRTKWDPYPWVSVVEDGSAAQLAGLQVGDCVLEVNGEDVVGQRIGEIAARVRSRPDCASLLVWNCGSDDTCDPEALLCCGPMPQSLKQMSSCLGAILGALECPVCLDTIPPPAHQCGNGHLMCAGCRARAERCPVCRERLCRGRSLLADQVFVALTDGLNVAAAPREEQSAKLRQKLMVLGKNKQREREQRAAKAPELKVSFTASNRFLTKLMGKSSSLNNLTTVASTSEEPVRGVRLSAVPRHLSTTPEFSAELKVKSLSTSEISQAVGTAGSVAGSPSSSTACLAPCPASPAGSPTPSPRGPRSRSPATLRASTKRFGSGLLDAGHLPLGSCQRPASCHASVESLLLESSWASPAEPWAAHSAPPAESLFRCPWSASCALRLPTARLVSHGRAHGGPLLLAFRKHVDVALPLPGPLCVQLPDPAGQPREFFVDTTRRDDDHILRAWLAAAPADCRSWTLRVSVHAVHDPAESTPVRVVRFQSISVDAPDLRLHDPEDAVDEEDGGSCSLRLPPLAVRLGMDFVVDPAEHDDALRDDVDVDVAKATASLAQSVHATRDAATREETWR